MFIYVKQFDIQKIDTTFTLSNVNLEISDWVWRGNERGFVWLHVIARDVEKDCRTVKRLLWFKFQGGGGGGGGVGGHMLV